MDGAPRDTHPGLDERIIEAYRAMTPAQRLEIACQLTVAARELAMMDIRRNHPDADEREVLLRLASRTMDPALLKRMTGWDVEVEGY